VLHGNAPLSPVGRQRLARLVVVDGWSVRRAAQRFQYAARERRLPVVTDTCTTLSTTTPGWRIRKILDDERKQTAAGFWQRANVFFAAAGITVEAVMTDNGACYRSREFAAALGTITHTRTRPYRPQTNGKVERFHRTLAAEWAYARTYDSDNARAATYNDWLHHYNHHRPHTSLGGQTPAARVHNLTGNYT
jgi:transposase InsO family protein